MVRPILEYCPIVTDGGPAWAENRMQVLQNDTLRVCSRIQNPRDANIDQLHELYDVERLKVRRNC